MGGATCQRRTVGTLMACQQAMRPSQTLMALQVTCGMFSTAWVSTTRRSWHCQEHTLWAGPSRTALEFQARSHVLHAVKLKARRSIILKLRCCPACGVKVCSSAAHVLSRHALHGKEELRHRRRVEKSTAVQLLIVPSTRSLGPGRRAGNPGPQSG